MERDDPFEPRNGCRFFWYRENGEYVSARVSYARGVFTVKWLK